MFCGDETLRCGAAVFISWWSCVYAAVRLFLCCCETVICVVSYVCTVARLCLYCGEAVFILWRGSVFTVVMLLFVLWWNCVCIVAAPCLYCGEGVFIL